MSSEKLTRLSLSDIFPESPYSMKGLVLLNNSLIPNLIPKNQPFSFDETMYMFCLKGSAKLMINFKENTLEENTICILFPNQTIERISSTEDFSFKMVAYSAEILSGFPFPREFKHMIRIFKKTTLKISGKDTQNLLRYYSQIVETFRNKRHRYFEQIIKSQLYSLSLEIAHLYAESHLEFEEKISIRNYEIVEHFFSLQQQYYREGRTASFFAEKMFITPKHLSTTLKKVTGRPIYEWIEENMIFQSKLLLKSTDMTISEISEELNFPSCSYFGRFFRKNTGMSPSEFRSSQD